MLEHSYIGCEHMLLALVREEEGRVALIFKSLNTEIERVRARVVRAVGPGPQVASGEVRFTREAKKALELSLHEALSLVALSLYEALSVNIQCVGPEHILLGLLHKEEGLATRSLSLLEADVERLVRASRATCIPSSLLASRRFDDVAEFARLHVEWRAAAAAGDFQRAAALDSRARRVGATIRTRSNELPEDRVAARIRALLR